MQRNIVVLGCGRVGATICKDLATEPNYSIHALDTCESSVAALDGLSNVKTETMDLSDMAKIKEKVDGADLVIGALPGHMGFDCLRAVIEMGRPFCDISFMPEDFLRLDEAAKKNKVTAVVDCGVAPGLTNLITGHVHNQLDATERVEIYACGLPKMRLWPYEYKAPFSPGDVIEEYTRPARMIEFGEVVEKPALTDPELIDFPDVGTLEAFNTDGLRSLVHTIKAKHMFEKTLRYPGHIHLIRALRDTGFFDTIHVDVEGGRVRPLDLTKKLLFPLWTLDDDEDEFTVIRVIVEGEKDKKHVRHTYELYDEYDPETKITSMSRCTGFPCAIVARMILNGEITDHGVIAPEHLGARPGMIDHMTQELAKRGVNLFSEVAELCCEM